MIDLTGKVVLVTAASRGMGANIVRHAARQGADIAFTYLSDAKACRELEEEIRSLGRRCQGWQACASDYARAQAVVSEVEKALGRLDGVVCNAGIARSSPLAEMTEEDWDQVMDVSLKGAFNYIRAAAPLFMRQNYGKLVCVGSINGLRGRVGSASYNTAKAGLGGLVKTAAAELGRYNVNANVVAPGFIETPSQRDTPELIRDIVLKECAIKRLGQPDDISPMIVFLLSDEARHVTGQVIKVDAGQYI